MNDTNKLYNSVLAANSVASKLDRPCVVVIDREFQAMIKTDERFLKAKIGAVVDDLEIAFKFGA